LAGRKKTRYQDAAEFLGLNPANYARSVAHVCGLLDAAATLEGVPLLALSVVRSSNNTINPEAWKNGPYPEFREAVIHRAQTHTFSRDDISKITLVSFPLITELVILTFCNKNWEFCDGPEALFRRRHLEVVA